MKLNEWNKIIKYIYKWQKRLIRLYDVTFVALYDDRNIKLYSDIVNRSYIITFILKDNVDNTFYSKDFVIDFKNDYKTIFNQTHNEIHTMIKEVVL